MAPAGQHYDHPEEEVHRAGVAASICFSSGRFHIELLTVYKSTNVSLRRISERAVCFSEALLLPVQCIRSDRLAGAVTCWMYATVSHWKESETSENFLFSSIKMHEDVLQSMSWLRFFYFTF